MRDEAIDLCGQVDFTRTDAMPLLERDAQFRFACAGCGDCCRQRRDLVLSGYDLYRIARRLSLSPRIVAAAFCKSYLAPESCLPALRLTPDPKTGNCRFFEGSACTIHAARPLACALYPLGQSIDTVTAQTEYYVQTPLCGARAGEVRTLQDYLQDSAVLDRAGVDARWAIICTQLSHRLQAAGGADNPRFSAAVRAVLSALWLTTEDRLVTVDLSAFRPACSARAWSAPSILALSELKSTRSTLSAASHWESP